MHKHRAINAIVRQASLFNGDNQTFLARLADNQTRNYNTRVLKTLPLCINGLSFKMKCKAI